MIAVTRQERLHTLDELLRWAKVEAEAAERGEHQVAKQAGRKMREVVQCLGFDPLDYEPARDAVGQIVSARVSKMLNAMPGTSRELADAAGLHRADDVRAYLAAYVERGEVIAERRARTTGSGPKIIHWRLA